MLRRERMLPLGIPQITKKNICIGILKLMDLNLLGAIPLVGKDILLVNTLSFSHKKQHKAVLQIHLAVTHLLCCR